VALNPIRVAAILLNPAATNGLSDDEVAAAMMFSPTAAKTHVSQAMTKLGARDRSALVFACQSGLVIPPNPRGADNPAQHRIGHATATPGPRHSACPSLGSAMMLHVAARRTVPT
jgi:hypothetical protein